MSAQAINTKADEAVALIEAGDFPAAKRKLLAVKALLAAKPDQQGEAFSLRWDRGAIDALIGQCERETAASATQGGIKFTNLDYI